MSGLGNNLLNADRNLKFTEGKIPKMLSKFKTTSLGDSSLTTRLGHNRKQNRTELIPLTEIYVNVKQRLGAENAAQLYCY